MQLISRTPHARCPDDLAAGRRETCEVRGFCGPFLNLALYDAFPGWEGCGDCVHCGTTVRVGEHEARHAGEAA